MLFMLNIGIGNCCYCSKTVTYVRKIITFVTVVTDTSWQAEHSIYGLEGLCVLTLPLLQKLQCRQQRRAARRWQTMLGIQLPCLPSLDGESGGS